MNAIEQIERILSETLPGAHLSLDRPKQPTGPWWLDAVLGEHSVTVEWRPKKGFGISSGSTESYGEGPDEVLEDAALAVARVILLLKTGEKTESPRDVELRRLREEKEISQEELARLLQMSQPAVSKMERRGDMSISTLRKIVAALGGELELVARFPDHAVRILHLGEGETT